MSRSTDAPIHRFQACSFQQSPNEMPAWKRQLCGQKLQLVNRRLELQDPQECRSDPLDASGDIFVTIFTLLHNSHIGSATDASHDPAWPLTNIETRRAAPDRDVQDRCEKVHDGMIAQVRGNVTNAQSPVRHWVILVFWDKDANGPGGVLPSPPLVLRKDLFRRSGCGVNEGVI